MEWNWAKGSYSSGKRFGDACPEAGFRAWSAGLQIAVVEEERGAIEIS